MKAKRKHVAPIPSEQMQRTRDIVAARKCPQCGAGLVYNSSIAGWWQCEQFGMPQFRKDPLKGPCNWQGFTQ